MPKTIGRLARQFGLARSTLLYYDNIGLLSPTGHSKGEYRQYSREDEKRLAQICRYRQVGLPLKDIGRILDAPENDFTAILEQRYAQLDGEIAQLREQQRIVAGLLKKSVENSYSTTMTKELWVSLLAESGFTEEDMRRWHIQFEKKDPEKHTLFLRLLGIPEEEIARIRALDRGSAGDAIRRGNNGAAD